MNKDELWSWSLAVIMNDTYHTEEQYGLAYGIQSIIEDLITADKAYKEYTKRNADLEKKIKALEVFINSQNKVIAE